MCMREPMYASVRMGVCACEIAYEGGGSKRNVSLQSI